MLEYLHIRNLALIEDMSLEFSNGINVLTGETGAGKSFILKALGFVLGDKLGADIVRPGAERAQVEALFTLPDRELVLRRELVASTGRSRFYIDDTLGTQEALKELRTRLVSHTSQHAQQQLLQPSFQTVLLESGFEKPELLQEREQLLSQLKKTADKIEKLQAKQGALAEKRELLEMQQAEIEKVAPKEGEEEELEELRAKIKAGESMRQDYSDAMSLLHGDDVPGILHLLSEFERTLTHMSKIEPDLVPDVEEIATFRQHLVELGNRFRKPPDSSRKHDMDSIESRLFAFAQLKRKLKRTMPQILELKEEIKQNLSFLDVCALDMSRLSKEKNTLETELAKVVAEIIPLRRKSAEEFARRLEGQLRDLGFSEHVRVQPDFVPHEIWKGVKDERGRILWAPNPGQNPMPLDKIASGGELSRFLLGLSTIGQDNENITYIFDEVDAGVGGLTLNRVADKLQDFSKNHQLILITHWPRLAARAKKHFQITKSVKDGNTFTQCIPLEGAAVAAELTRMAGGGKEDQALTKDLS